MNKHSLGIQEQHIVVLFYVSKTHLGEAEQQFVAHQDMFRKPLSLLDLPRDLIAQTERESVRQTVTRRAGIDLDYSLVKVFCTPR